MLTRLESRSIFSIPGKVLSTEFCQWQTLVYHTELQSAIARVSNSESTEANISNMSLTLSCKLVEVFAMICVMFCYKIRLKIPQYFSTKSRIFSRPQSNLLAMVALRYGSLQSWHLSFSLRWTNLVCRQHVLMTSVWWQSKIFEVQFATKVPEKSTIIFVDTKISS